MKQFFMILLGRFFKASMLTLFALFLSAEIKTQALSQPAPFDVINYKAEIEPDILNKTVSGKVKIRFVALIDDLTKIELDCGNLTIDAVSENKAAQIFEKQKNRLIISLSRAAGAHETRELEIQYHGKPTYGIKFFPEQKQVYTVFSTSQWLVCVDAPEEKASISLDLILPADLEVVANGRLTGKRQRPDNKMAYQWEQKTVVPSYVFGFAAGRFQKFEEHRNRFKLRYLSAQFSETQLGRIFRDTADAIEFYENRAGVRYADEVYTQVLAAGKTAQEMSSFAVMDEDYGRNVLKNEREIWLGAHELAHQWWGNMVTCRDWRDFWLNEGMATFMAVAYKEHRFGQEEYRREIENSRLRYEKVRDAGKDKSLVFPNWNNPTSEDRTLVYHKGAYVLHLLREEMGEKAFWTGVRAYTQKFWGKSVTTIDFQNAMQKAAEKDLSQFFDKWVYLTKIEN